jgi:hypothetical protein
VCEILGAARRGIDRPNSLQRALCARRLVIVVVCSIVLFSLVPEILFCLSCMPFFPRSLVPAGRSSTNLIKLAGPCPNHFLYTNFRGYRSCCLPVPVSSLTIMRLVCHVVIGLRYDWHGEHTLPVEFFFYDYRHGTATPRFFFFEATANPMNHGIANEEYGKT